ncbi:DUF1801 domain-containing protein [uncultured Litoreibacter sp.]|uniref:DUF1801 domain-containing protein n=1 Tax=uncultured Litoreibacter sp. TaxID=1392394 RepID=UPI002639D2AC|nr:DUF1801 domain-containing protein [uncultured Litoreibacter sp.]
MLDMTLTTLPAVFDDMPEAEAATLLEARDLIYAEAARLGVGPLEETLKWGQPSVVPPKKSGTTIRLGLLGGKAALFVHCQTTIIDQARELFGGVAEFSGNRALVLGGDPRATTHVICAALTYYQKR